MQVRDRIKELRRVKASELLPNPKNWRQHPAAQADALRGVLAEIGYADALIAYEPNGAGKLMLIDGHLRADTTPDQEVPVLVLDVTEAEADKLLLTLDPLAAMAEAGEAELGALLQSVETDSEALQAMLEAMADEAGIDFGEAADSIEYSGDVQFSESEIVAAILDDWPDWKTPADLVAVRITKPMAMAQFNNLQRGGSGGTWISALFNPHRLDTPKSSETSYFGGLSVDAAKLIQAKFIARHKSGGDYHPQSWPTNCGYGFGGSASADEFSPSIARDIYKTFCPDGGDVLDPCHGWGGRLIGWAASGITGTYTGVDPATLTSDGVQSLAEFLRVADRVTIHNKPFETVELKKKYDFAFTSPPYFDTEKYSDDKTQSCVKFPAYEKWSDGFMRPLIVNTLAAVRGCFVVNVGNARYPITETITKIAAEIGATCGPIDGYRIGRPLSGDDETIEDFLVLSK